MLRNDPTSGTRCSEKMILTPKRYVLRRMAQGLIRPCYETDIQTALTEAQHASPQAAH
jgi:hypothetical protein